MNFKKHFYLYLLIAIFILALVLRFYKLEQIPSGFHVDEANLGYNTYSILNTGKDDSGNFLPLYINMFNDFNPAGYDYLDLIPMAILGLNIVAVRFPAALFGALIVFPAYYIGAMLFKKRVGIIAALFCVFAPWGVVFSRGSAETIVATFFAASGIALLIRSVKYLEWQPVVAAATLFIISCLIYPAPRVILPLIFLAFLFYPLPFWKYKTKNIKLALIGCFAIMSIIIGLLIFNVGGGTARFNQVSIFSSPSTRLIEEEQIREDGVMGSSILSARIFHNKPIEYAWTFTNNYLQYFTGNFLFTQGGRPLWFVTPQIGLILIVQLPFILYGMYLVLKSEKRLPKLLFLWFLIPPAVAALTVDDSPNMRRALLMLLPLEIFGANGFVEVMDLVKGKIKTVFIFIVALVFIFNISFFFHQYFIHQPIHQNWYRNVEFDKVMAKIGEKYNQTDTIVFSKSGGGIYPLILFYSKYDPKIYQKEGSTKDREFTGFGKYFFVTEMCPSINGDDRIIKGRTIFVESGTCKATKDAKHEYILDFDRSPVYHMLYRDTTEE